MRILICDDNRVIIEELHNYIREFFSNMNGAKPELVCYDNGEDLLNKEQRADIAFLDVEMPGLSGIHIGARLKERNPHIKIFIVTSYPDYLDEAMRFQVFRYLSKPIDKNRLYRNLKDAVYQFSIETKEFPILTSDGISVRRAEEIVCIEASQRKIFVYTIDSVLISIQNMDFWRKELSLPCFYSPHRSYIINMRYVSAVAKDKIILKYGSKNKEAYLTRRKYSHFKNTYLIYQESVR